MMGDDDRARDDGRIWGHIEAGRFWPIPKGPMISAGFGPPPFAVTLPDGRVRQVVHQPETTDLALEIADRIVPEYRASGKSYSCTGTIALRWDAAFCAAEMALKEVGMFDTPPLPRA